MQSLTGIDQQYWSGAALYLGSQMSLVHIDPTFLFYILIRPFFWLGKTYMRVIIHYKYSLGKALITSNSKTAVGFHGNIVLKTTPDLRFFCSCDTSQMWSLTTSYLIEDAGDEAATGTKRQSMPEIQTGGSEVWKEGLLERNKYNFLQSNTLFFNFRQQFKCFSFLHYCIFIVYYNFALLHLFFPHTIPLQFSAHFLVLIL